jgi:hypothetical protein
MISPLLTSQVWSSRSFKKRITWLANDIVNKLRPTRGLVLCNRSNQSPVGFVHVRIAGFDNLDNVSMMCGTIECTRR